MLLRLESVSLPPAYSIHIYTLGQRRRGVARRAVVRRRRTAAAHSGARTVRWWMLGRMGSSKACFIQYERSNVDPKSLSLLHCCCCYCYHHPPLQPPPPHYCYQHPRTTIVDAPKRFWVRHALAYSLLLHTLALASDYTLPTSMKLVWRLLNMNWFSCSICQRNCRLHEPRTWHNIFICTTVWWKGVKVAKWCHSKT